MRIEKDSLGPVEIPDNVWWGPQTQRSLAHFHTGPLMPLSVIRALILIKQQAAAVNGQANLIKPETAKAIDSVCAELLALDDDQLRQHFPLRVFQTGSGTQTNMNVNEVIAWRAGNACGVKVLPNDDVNCGQSSNDTFPTAMHLAAYPAMQTVIQAVQALDNQLALKEKAYARTVKLGRTHLQDATPLTFGQEVSGWRATLAVDLTAMKQASLPLLTLPLGGTAVGTGLNTTKARSQAIIKGLAQATNIPFTSMANKFHGLSAHSELTTAHGTLKTLATDLVKIANDIRFLGSGPRGGYGELTLPANEPGSSIMPGKVNPTQAEALTMIAASIFGQDSTISFANSQGNFEMNVYKPVIIAAFLTSCQLLAGGLDQFTQFLVKGLQANPAKMQADVDASLMTVTALTPHIGYAASAKIAQTAQKQGLSLKQAAIASGKVSASNFDTWVDPLKMANVDEGASLDGQA